VKYVEPKPEKSRTVLQKFLDFTAREFLVFRVMTLKTQRRKPNKVVQQFLSGMILGDVGYESRPESLLVIYYICFFSGQSQATVETILIFGYDSIG
jgi:hypothetical protein